MWDASAILKLAASNFMPAIVLWKCLFPSAHIDVQYNMIGLEKHRRTSLNRCGCPAHVPLWHSVKKWPHTVTCCLALNLAILLYGDDLVIVGTVSAMPTF